ncbi:hypothetical protein [Aurantiacibacter flavus]|uniref:Ig-like domain-containing protein n=1 Tax=Aurantiacibacter flavus TaxID=3145232 RepID=A0ABV0CTF4_9SPHN
MTRIGSLRAMAVAASLFAASAAVAQAERDWSGIEGCAVIDDSAARHACLDRELAALGLLDRATVASAPPAPVAPPVTAQTELRTAETREKMVYEETAPREPVISEMASTVAAASLDRRQGLEVEAANGTRWRSTSSVSLRRAPRAGVPFAVEQGALGSYNCRIESSTYFKCEPLS